MRRLLISIVLGLCGYCTGVIASALAGSEPFGGWSVQPRRLHVEDVVDYRQCYVGTDGKLHEVPKHWVTW